jgi:O-antigen/teichoic acid export membrane protein
MSAGHYGAAQNVTVVAALFGMSYAGAMVTEATRGRKDPQRLAKTAQAALRLCLWLAPCAALGAVLAPLIVSIAFGPRFSAVAPLVAILAGATLFMTWSAFANAVLVGAGRGRMVLLTAGPALPLALIGHAILIPRYGAEGAAVCTLAVAFVSAAASWTAVIWGLGCRVPWRTLLASVAACAVVGVIVLWRALQAP